MSSWFNKAITRSWMSSTRSGTKYTLFPSLPFSNRRKKDNGIKCLSVECNFWNSL